MEKSNSKSPTDMCVDKTDCHYQDSRSKPSAELTKDVYRKQPPEPSKEQDTP